MLRRLTLSHWILIGLLLGIGCGVVLGELCQPLQVAGDVFIRLLQMTILPYIVVSLIANIGGLDASEARTLAGRGLLFQVIFWAVGLAMIVLMAQALPALTTASYYSAEAAGPASVDVLALYVPANPFAALADGAVPAAVVFSLAVGIALLGLPGKAPVVAQLDVLAHALLQVSGFVARFTPLGVFAIAAAAAGRVTIEELGRIQAFLIIHTLSVGLLAFLVLPWLVAALTPFRMRDVMVASRDGMVIAFTTGNIFIALPLLFEGGRRLFERNGLDVESTARPFEVVLPIVFSFPNAANLQFLLFVVFGAWFSGAPIEPTAMPQLLGAGFLSLFASDMVAIPLLLDMFRISADLFQLYVVTSIVAMRTTGLAAIVHLFGVALLVACALQGLVAVRARRLAVVGVASAAIVLVAGLLVRAYLARTVSGGEDGLRAFMTTPMIGAPPESMTTLDPIVDPEELVASEFEFDVPRIRLVRERGTIRVGYDPDLVPWTFNGPDGRLHGFDANLAWMLAEDLDVGLEFRPIEAAGLAAQLAQGHVDVVMSGFALAPRRMTELTFSDPVLELTLALVVPDHRRREFRDVAAIRAMEGLRLGVAGSEEKGSGYYADWLRRRLPGAVVTQVEDPGAFLAGREEAIDALVMSAEGGSIWSIIHPGFTVVVPKGRVVAVPMAYPVADESMQDFMNGWLRLKEAEGSIDRLRRHWLEGKSQTEDGPRWSVIRDVLGWIE